MADLRATFTENGKTYGWQYPFSTPEEAAAYAETIVGSFAEKERPVTDLTWKVYP